LKYVFEEGIIMGDVEASDSDNNEQIPMIDENIGKKSTKNRALLY
jgi:hypothetical protein